MERNNKALFESYYMEKVLLRNRFVMAPMTRSRSSEPGNVPNELMARYYAQRSSAGLIISEATQISLQGQGYARTPGIYTDRQVNGWQLVTRAVHDAGSKIFLQLWHVGRVSSAQVNGLQPIAPSAIPARDTSVYIFDGAPNGDASFVPVDEPREMTEEDIHATIADFANGAQKAIEAGFDGVEIHGANGYLIDQFLRSNSNQRNDEYGGSPQNRIRFLIEVVRAVTAAVGTYRVGVRLSPFIKFKDMDDPEILETIMLAVEALEHIGIAYIHLCEADWEDAPSIPEEFRIQLRKSFTGTLIATGNKTPEEGDELIRKGQVDLIGFGRNFIANPDYPEKVKNYADIKPITQTRKLFGGGGAEGYTDY